ncbi:MAG: response regulator [Lachnospiraceae bacterium]|nr:response regulator [Lachnospiraceae bacterium]
MIRKDSIVIRIWVTILIVVMLACGLVCIVSFIMSQETSKSGIRQRMLDIANCAAVSVNGDDLESLTKEDEGTEKYRRIYDALAAYGESADTRYVYAVRDEGDGRFTFIIDTDPENSAALGQEIQVTDALTSAAQGVAAANSKHHTDEWGTFYSAYSPVFDSDGKVAGIIGVDFTVSWYEKQLRSQTKSSITVYLNILFIAMIIAGIFCFVQIRAITKPLEHITVVAEKYGRNDFSEKLEVEREDEIGVLSRSLQSMATSLTEQIRNAEEANRAKSVFLANMSHEIRTPINAVLGMNEMIRRESADEEILAYSENIRAAGGTLLSLINDILDFSKIESGKMDLVLVDYDLSSVINDLVNIIRKRAETKGLELKLEIDPAIPKHLHGDEVRVKQIITNILTNAVKYTEEGSILFQISYDRTASDDKSVIMHVAVRDTGIGIREADLEKVFSEFQRIDEKRNRRIEGTGLGLSITQGFLEMMGSSLQVESVYGEGSCFHFDLKQGVIDWEELGDYEAAYQSYARNKENYRESFTAPDARVLIVDDNQMNLEVFRGLIKKTQIRTDTAASGDEGLQLCANNRYDIIFLDHMMPVKDGIETLKELRARDHDPNENTPAVCLTANAISGAREEYLEAGFDDYLTKPIDPDALEKMLLRYLPSDRVLFAHADEKDGEPAAETAPSSDASASLLSALKDQELISTKTGIMNSGSAQDYLKMLRIFSETVEEKISEIDAFYADKDLQNYTIKVHALKSSAGIIGAQKLREDAQALENAGKAGDTEYIDSHHARFLDDVRAVAGLLEPLIRKEEPAEKEMADEALITGFYDELLTAAQDMDCDTIEELFTTIGDYAFPPGDAELIRDLKAKAERYEYGAIEETLREHIGV